MDKDKLKVKEGDLPSASKWNGLVDLASSPPIVVGNGLESSNIGHGCNITLTAIPPVKWIGKISDAGPSGESNYTNNRYWVIREFVSNTSPPATYADETGSTNPNTETVTATNLAEVMNGCHGCPKGLIVEVTESKDAAYPPQIQYTFEVWIPQATAIYQVLMSVDDLPTRTLAMRYMCFHA
jgi:hypothetical protein